MVLGRLGRLGTWLVVMLAVILTLVLVDVGIVAVRLTSAHPVGSQEAGQQDDKSAKHPCNHGNEVSKAAHQHKTSRRIQIAVQRLGADALQLLAVFPEIEEQLLPRSKATAERS